MHCVPKASLHPACEPCVHQQPKRTLDPCLSFQNGLVLPYAIVTETHEESSQDIMPLLQVFFWLTEATADSKESRWNCIREKLGQVPCQNQDQMQQSQQQQQQQEQGGIPIQGLGLQTGLVQQPAGAGPSMPAPAHLGLQAAKLTDAEKTRSAVYADSAAGVTALVLLAIQANDLG